MPRPRKLTDVEKRLAKKHFGDEVMVGRDTRFKPGQSGNPRGRPQQPDGLIDTLIWRLGKTGAKSIADRLIALAENETGKVPFNVQLQAIEYIYDRIEGKPRQAAPQESGEPPLIVQLFTRLIDDNKALEGRQLPAGTAALPADSGHEAEVRAIDSGGPGPALPGA